MVRKWNCLCLVRNSPALTVEDSVSNTFFFFLSAPLFSGPKRTGSPPNQTGAWPDDRNEVSETWLWRGGQMLRWETSRLVRGLGFNTGRKIDATPESLPVLCLFQIKVTQSWHFFNMWEIFFYFAANLYVSSLKPLYHFNDSPLLSIHALCTKLKESDALSTLINSVRNTGFVSVSYLFIVCRGFYRAPGNQLKVGTNNKLASLPHESHYLNEMSTAYVMHNYFNCKREATFPNTRMNGVKQMQHVQSRKMIS